MTITLPNEIRDELEQRAKAGRFRSVDAYITHLVISDDGGDAVPGFVGSPEITPRTREDMQRMLDDGMASGPGVVADAAFWAERRRVLSERLAARSGEPS